MTTELERFARAMQRFDAVNATDPDGKALPYAAQMTRRLDRFEPDASEALKLAARSQHIRRWEIPRSSYPAGRTGYLKWRHQLYGFHADVAAAILREEGYDEDTIATVRRLLQKEHIKNNPQMQSLEDIACLVFLEHYLAEFAHLHDEEKLINILQRTWAKMSLRGREVALALDMAEPQRALVTKALADSS